LETSPDFLGRSRGHAKFVAQRFLKGTSLDEKRNSQLTERRKVLLQDVDVNDIISVFGEEERSLVQENDRGVMPPSTKAEGDT